LLSFSLTPNIPVPSSVVAKSTWPRHLFKCIRGIEVAELDDETHQSVKDATRVRTGVEVEMGRLRS
jgi:hypothetical protein